MSCGSLLQRDWTTVYHPCTLSRLGSLPSGPWLRLIARAAPRPERVWLRRLACQTSLPYEELKRRVKDGVTRQVGEAFDAWDERVRADREARGVFRGDYFDTPWAYHMRGLVTIGAASARTTAMAMMVACYQMSLARIATPMTSKRAASFLSRRAVIGSLQAATQCRKGGTASRRPTWVRPRNRSLRHLLHHHRHHRHCRNCRHCPHPCLTAFTLQVSRCQCRWHSFRRCLRA